MGWFFVNLLVPATLPLAILLALRLVDLPTPYSTRASPLRAVRDGQLGWVAMGFAASCTYELWGHLNTTAPASPEWTGYVFALSVVFLVLSGVLSMAGTLFPFDESKFQPVGFVDWLRHYKLFAGTAVSTVVTALLYALVHYSLPVAKN